MESKVCLPTVPIEILLRPCLVLPDGFGELFFILVF